MAIADWPIGGELGGAWRKEKNETDRGQRGPKSDGFEFQASIHP